VPTQLSEIKTLTLLNLATTSLSGTISPHLTKLTELTVLDLDTTSLSGTIPGPQLTKLTELTNLNLGHTSLSGTLPSSVGALPALTILDLYDMRLSGTVPASVLRHCLPFKPRRVRRPAALLVLGLWPRSLAAQPPVGRRLRALPVARENRPQGIARSGAAARGRHALHPGRRPLPALQDVWIASASLILSHLQIVGLLSSLASVESVSSGGALATLRAALLVCIDQGTVEPQCLLEPPPELQYTLKNVVHKDGTSTQVAYAVFDLHAFLTSPEVVGTATACALPVVAFLALTLAKLAAKRRSPPTTARTAAPPALPPPLPAPLQPEAPAADAPEPPPSPPAAGAANDEEVTAADEAAPEAAPPAPPDATQASDGAEDAASAKAAIAALALVDKYENWTVIVFSLQLPTLFRVGLRTVVLGAYGDTHYPLGVGVPVVFLELAYALSSSFATCVRWRGDGAALGGGTRRSRRSDCVRGCGT